MSQHLFIIPVMHPAADTVDSSEEDMPLSALAGRHTSGSQTAASAHAPQARPQARAQNQAQPQAGAQAPAVPASQRVARSRKADKLDAKPGLHVPNKVTAPMELSSIAVVTGAAADADAPAEKDTSAAHQGSPESAPAVVTAAAAEVPAENDSAAARQGSPEPALAPANVEVRTTRSQSRRMSMEASPSVTTSVMTRSALKGQSGGQAAMTKPPPAGRKRSATPAYPPAAPEASPTAAAAASADGDAQGAPVVSNKKHRSRSVDGDSKQGVAPADHHGCPLAGLPQLLTALSLLNLHRCLSRRIKLSTQKLLWNLQRTPPLPKLLLSLWHVYRPEMHLLMKLGRHLLRQLQMTSVSLLPVVIYSGRTLLVRKLQPDQRRKLKSCQ